MENQIEKRVMAFYNELTENENHRFESWEHCYIKFQNAFNKESITDEEKDVLSLHLAFYLASWGMYRGSSFILQKDYKVFYPIVDLLFKERKKFNEIIINEVLDSKNTVSIESYVNEHLMLDKELETMLENIRSSVKGTVESTVSYTLKTKIILGTYGTIPAYDRFFENGIRATKEDYNLLISHSKNGIIKLLNFAKDKLPELNNIKEQINHIQKNKENLNNVDYPIMKIIDMYFWKIGFDAEEINI